MRNPALLAVSLMTVAVATSAWGADQPVTDNRPTVGGAIATPAQDLNIKRTEIPEVLVKAQANPYDAEGLKDCGAIAAEVASLDTALGADKDAPTSDDAPKASTVGMVLTTGVQAVIPYRGVIRQVSGAAARDKAMNEAIRVGFARRGFLKGKASEMNCPAGASPAGYIQRPELAPAPVDVTPAPDLPAAPLFSFDAQRASSNERPTAAPNPEPAAQPATPIG